MLFARPPATFHHVCVRCVLRLRLDALRQRRLKHTALRDLPNRPEATGKPARQTRLDHTSTHRHQKSVSPPINQHTPHNAFRKTWASDARSSSRHSDEKNQLTYRRADGSHKNFFSIFGSRLQVVKEEVRNAPLLTQVARDARENKEGKESSPGFGRLWKEFVQSIHHSSSDAGDGSSSSGSASRASVQLLQDLAAEYRNGGVGALDGRIKYHFYGHVTGSRFSERDIENQQGVADLRYPTEWFPATRTISRTIHLHVGPTNSGKTYHALQRLEKAEKGTYAGPLRLLAHEVFTRMNARGRKCSLVTGEERRLSQHSEGTQPDDLIACTVEMAPLNTTLDVAVIDEIQMIGSPDRGWAWTQALLGIKAKEIHLCGEERTVPLIREICASTGEKLEIHKYQRLSPLQVADTSLDGDFSKLKKGDCIVSFSVMGIHALRRQIEKVSGRKVAIVYGSLPPETRAQQARLFNDPDNDYDFLVASDAVGMGLNLAIKRMIFETSTKFDGFRRHTLGVADIKQIAGRAGRFRTAAQVNDAPASEQDIAAAKGDASVVTTATTNKPSSDENVGIVTTLEQFDFPIVSHAMVSEPEPITSAGVYPPSPVVVRFASYFPPGTPFSFILTRLHELSKMHRRFHLCGLRDQVWIADLIEPVQGLTISDRNTFVAAPASKTDGSLWKDLMPAFAQCVADQRGVNIADIKELPLEVLEANASPSREYLRELERLHKGVVVYLWLSYRFAGVFNTRSLAFHVKELVEQKIEEVLANFSFSEARRRQIIAQREKQLLQDLMLDDDGNVLPKSHSETPIEPSFQIEDDGSDNVDGSGRKANPDQEPPRRRSVNVLDAGFVRGPGNPRSEDDDQQSLEANLQHQRSQIYGGDRFSGEEDVVLDEPVAFEEGKRPGYNTSRVDQGSRFSGPVGQSGHHVRRGVENEQQDGKSTRAAQY